MQGQTAGSATQRLSARKAGVVVPFSITSELPSFDVNVMVMPPNHFEGDKGPVVSFSTTTGYVAAMRVMSDNQMGVYLYADNGNRITTEISKGAFLPYVLSTKVIREYLRDKGNIGLDFEGIIERGATPNSKLPKPKTVNIAQLCQDLGIHESYVEPLAYAISDLAYSLNQDGRTLAPSFFDKDYPFLPEYGNLIPDPKRSSFFFLGTSSITVYETKTKSGTLLDPDKWIRTVVPLEKLEASALIKENPWLRKHLGASTEIQNMPEFSLSFNSTTGLEVALSKSKAVVFHSAASNFTIEPLPQGNIYFTVKGESCIYRLTSHELKNLESEPGRSESEVEKIPLPRSGEVTGLSFDPNGNFLLARVSAGTGHEDLLILDQASLRLSAVIPEVAPSQIEGLAQAFEVDGRGNLTYVDREGTLRYAKTSMGAVAQGSLRDLMQRQAATSSKEQQRLHGLAEQINALTTPESSTHIPNQLTPQYVQRQLEDKLEELFHQKINNAQTTTELDEIQRQVDSISSEKDYRSYQVAFDPTLEKISVAMSRLLTARFLEQLTRVEALLSPENVGWVELIEASKLFERISIDRHKTVIRSESDRRALSEMTTSISSMLTEKQEIAQPQLIVEIEARLKKIKEQVEYCYSAHEVDVLSGEESPATIGIIGALPDPSKSKQYIATLKGIYEERKKEIQALNDSERRREREEQMGILTQLAALRESIQLELLTLGTQAEVGKIRRSSPLVTEYASWMDRLSENLIRFEQEKLDTLFNQHSQRLATAPQFSNLQSNLTWHELLPVFTAPDIVWSPELEPDLDNPEMGRLLFRDNLERVFDPENDLLPLNPEDPRVLAALHKNEQRAKEYFEGVLRDIPAFSEEWVINAWTEKVLSQFGRVSKQQLRGDNGIIIVRSEAGLGKNIMFDIFACLTRRSLMTFSCNINTEVDDLTFMYQYDPAKKGTYKLNSQFLNRIQIPGSIILLDEVNSLPAGVKKVLNSLFDYRRTLYLPDGRSIKAHPTTIFIGVENGVSAAYQGVGSHSADFVSRARVIELEYPAFQEANGYYTPYEAELYAKQLQYFKGMSSSDFAKAWDDLINSSRLGNKVQSLLSPEKANAMRTVKQLVQTAETIRRLNKNERDNGQTGYVFTPRDGRQVIAEIRDGFSLHDALINVIMPKIEDREYRGKVKAAISGVVPSQSASQAA